MNHSEDAKAYITVPGVHRGEGIKHPAFAPGSKEERYKAEIQRLRRLARVLLVALVLASIGLLILLVIIGFGVGKNWNPSGPERAQCDFPAIEGVLTPSALAWGEGCLQAFLSPAFGKERP